MKKAGCAKVALAEAPPFVTISSDGKAGGYLPAVSADVLRSLVVPKLCPEAATYDAMIPGLQARRFDLLPGGLNITPERCQVIAFSQPLTAQHEALAVPAGNPHGITSYAAFAKRPGLTLAVFSGSSQEAFARKNGEEVISIPVGQIRDVSNSYQADPGSFGRKLLFGIFASRNEEYLFLSAETPERAEVLIFKTKRNLSPEMVVKIWRSVKSPSHGTAIPVDTIQRDSAAKS